MEGLEDLKKVLLHLAGEPDRDLAELQQLFTMKTYKKNDFFLNQKIKLVIIRCFAFQLLPAKDGGIVGARSGMCVDWRLPTARWCASNHDAYYFNSNLVASSQTQARGKFCRE